MAKSHDMACLIPKDTISWMSGWGLDYRPIAWELGRQPCMVAGPYQGRDAMTYVTIEIHKCTVVIPLVLEEQIGNQTCLAGRPASLVDDFRKILGEISKRQKGLPLLGASHDIPTEFTQCWNKILNYESARYLLYHIFKWHQETTIFSVLPVGNS